MLNLMQNDPLTVTPQSSLVQFGWNLIGFASAADPEKFRVDFGPIFRFSGYSEPTSESGVVFWCSLVNISKVGLEVDFWTFWDPIIFENTFFVKN